MTDAEKNKRSSTAAALGPARTGAVFACQFSASNEPHRLIKSRSAAGEDSVQVVSSAAGVVLCWHGTKCPVQMESAPYAVAPLPERIARLQVTCRGTELVIVRDKGEGKIFLNGVACGKIISGVLRSLLSVEAQAEPYLLPIAALLWTAEELERCENV